MTLVVIFNGQGEQRREHVERLLRDAPPDLADPLNAALAELGLELHRLTDRQLVPSRVAQPVICAYQLTLWRKLAPRLPGPSLFAGYSLGEIAALSCAGAIAPDEAVTLASLRGRFMDEAVSVPSGLVAVLGLTAPAVAGLCRTHGAEIAIRNGPEHFIVGGPVDALAGLANEAAELGANRTAMLDVTTPSHTSMLAKAASRFGAELQGRMRDRLAVPVLSAVDASVLRSGRAAAVALETQICRAIDWAACMEAIIGYRPDAVLEIGPGTALSRMLHHVESVLDVRAIDEFRTLDAVVDWVCARIPAR